MAYSRRLDNNNSMLAPLMLMILFIEISGEACNMGFPEAITMGNNNITELDVIPEDTQVLIPSLTITCDGYISHVSVGYKANPYKSASYESVYLQLWRNTVGMRKYSLVKEVLLPPGDPWPGSNNLSILEDFELPSRILVQSNDVIGFRTPYNSSVKVLVNTINPRRILEYTLHGYNNVLNITGIPQITIRNRKTCHRGLPNSINVSASDKGIVPIRSVLGNIQAIFPSTTFTCNGVINQITGWYQVHIMDDLNNSMIVPASINFQIWHPISDSHYKLVSEASFPSALDDEPRTVNNLTMQFYSGSVVGIYIQIEPFGYGLGTMTVLRNNDVPQSLLYITDDKPCIFDTVSTGVLSIEPIDAEIVLDYDVNNEEVDQIFYCKQDDQIADNKTKTTTVIVSTTTAIALIVIIIILILVVTCCWRRYKLQKHTGSHDDESALLRSSSHSKSFVSVRYYRLESNLEARPLASASYAVISESTKATFKNPISDYEQICSELTEVEISSDEIELGDEIGSGNFGVVYHGLWNHRGRKDQVAIKTLHNKASEEEKLKLLREASTVQQFLHINIIKFYGVITSRERVMVVLEYLPNGSLLDFLRSARPKKGEPVNQLLPQILLRFAREIACGMNYLSNKCFIHRDLAARNVLLSEENACKIADFGLSRDVEDDYYITQGGLIPVKWTAPEALLFRRYTTASDVWSYGIVLYEMWSLGERPYGDYDNSEVSELIGTGYRLPPPPGCARHIYNLMIQCWNPVHRLRPSFSAILKTILQPPYVLIHWFDEDKQAAGSQCDVLGAPLEAGHNLYLDLQNAYK